MSAINPHVLINFVRTVRGQVKAVGATMTAMMRIIVSLQVNIVYYLSVNVCARTLSPSLPVLTVVILLTIRFHSCTSASFLFRESLPVDIRFLDA